MDFFPPRPFLKVGLQIRAAYTEVFTVKVLLQCVQENFSCNLSHNDFAATQVAGQVFNVSCNLGDRYKNLQHKLQKDNRLNSI